MNHKPIYIDKDGVIFYVKTKLDDNFIHKNTKTISINADYLKFADYVVVLLKHKGIVLATSKERLMKEGFVKQYNSEEKYYLPIEEWAVRQGNKEWYKDYIRGF